jgi:hypothetical protein
LEALLARFNLIVDSGRDAAMFSCAGFRTSAEASQATGSSVLSYDGFLAFWDESGIKELLGQVRYHHHTLSVTDVEKTRKMCSAS